MRNSFAIEHPNAIVVQQSPATRRQCCDQGALARACGPQQQVGPTTRSHRTGPVEHEVPPQRDHPGQDVVEEQMGDQIGVARDSISQEDDLLPAQFEARRPGELDHETATLPVLDHPGIVLVIASAEARRGKRC